MGGSGGGNASTAGAGGINPYTRPAGMGGQGGTPTMGTGPGPYGGPAARQPRPFRFLTAQQILDFRGNRREINTGARDARQNLQYQLDMARLTHTQTRSNVLRSLGQSQSDVQRAFDMNRTDLERGIGRNREDLQRSFDRQLGDVERGFDRAEQDLGVQRQRDMTALVDSLGARGLVGSGLQNRFQGEAAQGFDRATSRLGEDRALSTGRLNDDLAFGLGRLDDDLSFGLGRLTENRDFNLGRLQSNVDYDLGNMDLAWEQQQGGFDIGFQQIDNQRDDALIQNLGQREVWNAEGAANSVRPGSAGRTPAKKAPAKKPAKKAPAKRPAKKAPAKRPASRPR